MTKKALFGLALAAGLAAGGCDDEDLGGGTTDVNLRVNMTATTANAIKGKEFSFPMGIAAIMGATGPTTVTFTAANAATFKRMNMMTNAMVAYGSCTFTVAAGGAVPAGTYTVNPCAFTIMGREVPLDQMTQANVQLVLGGNTSTAVGIDVRIMNGMLFVGGVSVGTITGAGG